MVANIYNSLTKSLTMYDDGDFNYYPIRVSAAGAITELITNQYFPPDWLPLLQVLVNMMGIGDENESCLFFNLLNSVVEAGMDKVAAHIPFVVSNIIDVVILKNIPTIPEPWPQMLERGFAALAQVAQIWENSLPDDIQIPENEEWRSSWAFIAKLFSNLLHKAWLMASIKNVACIHDASTLLGFVMRFVTERNELTSLKVTELLTVWSTLIADWDSWEELEDYAIFNSIHEAVNLQRKCELPILFNRRIPLANSSQGSTSTIYEGICGFVTQAIKAYPSAVWRACSCIHALLHVPSFSSDFEPIKHAMTICFTKAAFSHFRDINQKPIGLWKPLLFSISSCYILYPQDVERVLEKEKDKGFVIWAIAVAHMSSSTFNPSLSNASEITMSVVTLMKVVERLLISGLHKGEVLRECFIAMLDAFTRLKEVQEENEEVDSDVEESDDNEDNDDEGDDYDEDSEDDQLEETEEEFLDRYAKAAADLEVDEGDVEDNELELELGSLDEMDLESSLLQLIKSSGQELMQGQALPPSLVQKLKNSFPEQPHLFQIS